MMILSDFESDFDSVSIVGNSILQHGKFNDRIYLMKMARDDFPSIIDLLDKMAIENRYSKIFAKVPNCAKEQFENAGYIEEAHILYHDKYGNIDKLNFMGKFFTRLRENEYRLEEIKKILEVIKRTKAEKDNIILSPEYMCDICKESDVNQVADIYKKVFKAYPFPIHDSEYISKIMHENFIFFCIKKDDKIIAVSSCEIYDHIHIAEMTDFATIYEYRHKGLASYLLSKMEEEMKNQKMKGLYTISRSLSCGVNKIFVNMNYIYGGLLVNNTNISVYRSNNNKKDENEIYKDDKENEIYKDDKENEIYKDDKENEIYNDKIFESMNVWYKLLS